MKFIKIISFSIITVTLAIGILGGCTSEDSVSELPEDELKVKHWSDLEEERKYRIVRNAMDEGKIYMSEDGYEEYIEFHTKVIDRFFLDPSYKDYDLKKAIISVLKDWEVGKQTE